MCWLLGEDSCLSEGGGGWGRAGRGAQLAQGNLPGRQLVALRPHPHSLQVSCPGSHLSKSNGPREPLNPFEVASVAQFPRAERAGWKIDIYRANEGC